MTNTESWPDGDVPFRFPIVGDGVADRWAAAICAGIEDGTLALRRLTEAPGSTDLLLVGPCPRCGHEMETVVPLYVLVPDRVNRFLDNVLMGGPVGPGPDIDALLSDLSGEIVCSCAPDTHAGRREDEDGCGWGRGLRVPLDERWIRP